MRGQTTATDAHPPLIRQNAAASPARTAFLVSGAANKRRLSMVGQTSRRTWQYQANQQYGKTLAGLILPAPADGTPYKNRTRRNKK
jgi:hypothetical protein